MLAQKPADLMDSYRAACDWWDLAGVSHDFSDDAIDWLASGEALGHQSNAVRVATELGPVQGNGRAAPTQKDTRESALPAALTIDPQTIGADLDQFQEWWRADNETFATGAGPRISPRGVKHAELMMIVPQPEKSDFATLLSGEFGDFISAFLSCTDVDNNSIYFASVIPQYADIPDWRSLSERGIGRLLSYHIRLVKPRRVVIFGRHLPALIGDDASQPMSKLKISDDNQGQNVELPALIAPAPSELLRSPERRKRFWQNWLQWSDQFGVD